MRRNRPRIRPTYSSKIAAHICERLAAGESLRSICSADAMPSEATVRGWAVDDYCGFAAQYTRARDVGLDCLVERSLQVAEDGSRDYVLDANGKQMLNTEHVQRSRLICDQIKWYASKLAPKRYGDRISQEVSGPGGEALTVQLNIHAVAPTTGGNDG